MSHVFISYVRNNSATVDRLARDLRHAGVTVWLDRDAIHLGARWNEAIESAIRNGAFFIACYSREYLGRKTTYMEQELALAKWVLSQQRLPHDWFLPVLLNPCKPSELGLTTDEHLRTIQLVDLSNDWHDGLRRILSVIEPERAYGRCRSVATAEASRRGDAKPLQRVTQLAIDFGTSFSMASYYAPSIGWQAVKDAQGRALQPSVITFADNWDYFAGWDALSAAQHRPERAIFNMKRQLGKAHDFRVGHKRFDPVTTASLMIRYLRDCAEHELGYPVQDVLVSRPADFSARQTEALADACARAGLKIKRILAEPVAAALVASDWANHENANGRALVDGAVVVIDVGGGTTDVSVVELAKIDDEVQVEVLAVTGDNELGGMDYDEIVFKVIKSQFIEPMIKKGMSWTEVNNYRLRIETARAKAVLAQSELFQLALSDIEVAPGTLGTIELKLDRSAFRREVRPLDTRFASLVDIALKSSGIEHRTDGASLVAVLLAGQGARIFTIAEYLRRRFASLRIISEFQENAVARGLSSQVGVLTGHLKNLLLLDVICRPILLQVMTTLPHQDEKDGDENNGVLNAEVSTVAQDNRQLHTLVAVDTTIPWKSHARLRTANAGNLTLQVVEGDRKGTVATHTLASLNVDAVAKGDELELVVDIDADAIYRFTVSERKTRKKLVDVTYSYFGNAY